MDNMDDHINEEDAEYIIDIDDDEALARVIEEVELSDEENEEEREDGDEDMMAEAFEVVDMSDMIFSKHKDSVFCVSVDPQTSELAVTGGQDDLAYVWKIATGEVILECTGHKDSVTCTEFSHDGVYVATADMLGLVKVWKVATKEEIWSFECSDTEWLRWHPMAHVLLLGTVDGDVWMWKIPSGECKTFQGAGSTTSTGLILNDGKRVCVGYDDGVVKVWDLKGGTLIHSFSGHDTHTDGVTCMDCNGDGSLLMTGSSDVAAKIFNTNTGKTLNTFDCKSRSRGDGDNADNSVEAVGISYVQNYAATGTVFGDLSIWDMSTQVCRHTCRHAAGIVGLVWDRLSPLVYTSCLDGVVRLWDGRSGQVASQWSGHMDAILDFSISKDGKSLVTVSEDKTARVFSLQSPER